MSTAVAIIIAIIGSTGLSALIQFLISRHDKKHDALKEIIERLDNTDKKLDKTERDSVRLQLLFMISFKKKDHKEIMDLAKYYFDDLNGNWYASPIFYKWMQREELEMPPWFNMKE